jgi:excisionase family DNA binding protein
MSGEKDLITAHELAKELDLAVDTIWRYTREKKIPFVELGGKQYRYRKADVINSLSVSKVGESLANYGDGGDHKMTYREYCDLPAETGYRYEVLDGILVRDPSPNVAHQYVIPELWLILREYFRSTDPEGEVFVSPLDVTIGNYTVVQPDLLYVAKQQSAIIRKERVDGVPTLAVEVFSPSSGRKDRMQKMGLYQKAGVEHYWLVDPEAKTIECYSLHDGLYARVAGGMDDEVVEHPELAGLKIDLSKLWYRKG